MPALVEPSVALDSGIHAGKTALRHPRREAGIQVTGTYASVGGALRGTGFRRPCRKDGALSSSRGGGDPGYRGVCQRWWSPPWHWIPASMPERRHFVILAGRRGSRLQGRMPALVEPSVALDSGVHAGTTVLRHPRGEAGILLQGCMPPLVEALHGTGFRRPCRNDGGQGLYRRR